MSEVGIFITMADVISMAFWGSIAFFGGITYMVFKKWVIFAMMFISGVTTFLFFVSNVAQAMMIDGITTLINVLTAFGYANPVSTFFAMIAGLFFGGVLYEIRLKEKR